MLFEKRKKRGSALTANGFPIFCLITAERPTSIYFHYSVKMLKKTYIESNKRSFPSNLELILSNQI